MSKLTTRAAFLTLVANRLGNVESTKLAPDAAIQDQAVEAALDEYSKYIPHVNVYEAAGDDTTKRYVLSTVLGAGWKDGDSRVHSVHEVEDPNTDDEEVVNFDDDEITVRKGTDGKDVLFLPRTIPSSKTLRIVWHDRQVISATASETTIVERDTETLILLAVSCLEQWIARRASDLTDAALGGDQVDFEHIASRYRQRAKEDHARAIEILAPDNPMQSAGAAVEWDTDSELTGDTRVSH